MNMKKKGKTVCSTRENYLTINQTLARRDRKRFCKMSNCKAGAP